MSNLDYSENCGFVSLLFIMQCNAMLNAIWIRFLLLYRYDCQPVAVKIIQPSRTSAISLEKKERFQREVMLLSRMNHENVIQVILWVQLMEFTLVSYY